MKQMSNDTKYAIAFSIIAIVLFYGCHILHVRSLPKEVISIENTIPKVINNVVHIRNNSGPWQGSGVLLTPDIVMTARHVAETGVDFTVRLNNGKLIKAERAITSKKYDLGLIKLSERIEGVNTTVGDMNDCRLGQIVFAIGSPYGEVNTNSVTAGVISALNKKLEDFGCSPKYGWGASFQTDAAGHPGNSGCPIYTLDGKVRGILVGGFSNAIIYCIPAVLIANDCQIIELMFLMDEYKKEEKPEFPAFTPSYVY